MKQLERMKRLLGTASFVVRHATLDAESRRIAFALLRARLGLHFAASRVVRALIAESPVYVNASEARALIAAHDRLVERFRAISAEFPLGLLCLPRAIALRSLLRAANVPAVVRIGVKRSDGERPHATLPIEGHAWVEVGGIVVNDSEESTSRYAVYESTSRPRS